MPGISSTSPLSPLSPRQGPLALRVPQPALAPAASRPTGDSFEAPPGLAGAAGGISAIERAVHGAQAQVDELDRVGVLLNELRGLVGTAQRSDDGAGLAEIQSRIDSIVGTISDASAQAVAGRQPTYESPSLGYSLFRNESITTSASGYAKFAPGQEAFGLDVVVTTSAQQGGFLLSFGGTQLNLGGAGAFDGANSAFRIEVAGARGARELSFASGTQISTLVDSVNLFSSLTGVTATLRPDGTSIFLRSDEYGSDAFTSVRINDSGSINSAKAWAGIYQLRSDNTNALAPGNAGRVLFSAASNDVVDHGQDVQATIGGVQATTKGLNIRAASGNWRVNIDLAAGFAAGVRSSTPIVWFFPNSSPASPAGSTEQSPADSDAAQRPAAELVPGLTTLTAEYRAEADERLAALKAQLRAALGAPQKVDEKQTHLETLAALRKSLLGQ